LNYNIFKRLSLKTKITVFTLAIFLVGILPCAFYANRMLHEDMERLAGEQQFSAVSFIAAGVNEELGNRLEALRKVAEQVSPVILSNPVALQALLEQHLFLHILFNGGTFITRIDGNAIASIPLSAGRLGVNYMDRDYITTALNEGKATIGRPVVGKRLQAPVFSMGVPIRNNQGKVIGALVGVTNLGIPNFLDKITENRYGTSGGYLLVAKLNRLIVTATNRSSIMKQIPASGVIPLIDRFIQGYEGSGVSVDPTGVEVLASAKGIPLAGWYVSAEQSTAEVFAPFHAMQQRMLLATILLTLLAGGLIWWMLKRQLSPMLATVKILAALSDTDQHPQPLPITNQDEIGELIGGFNRILETLGQREEALRESEERYHMIFKNSPLGIMHFDVNGTIIDFNDKFAQILGAPKEKIVGFNMLKLLRDQEMLKTVKDALDGRLGYYEGDYLSVTGGKSTPIRALYQGIISEDGKFLGAVGLLEDISERKQAEVAVREHRRQLNDIIEFLPDATLAIDKEGRVIIWNKAIEEMTGVPASEIIGKGDYAYTVPFYGEARPQLMDLVFSNHEEIANIYPSINREGGSIIAESFCKALYQNKGAWVMAKASPLHDQSDNIIGAIESVRDITPRKQAEEALARLNAQLQAKNKELEQVVYVASHDLRSPLVNIDGYGREIEYSIEDLRLALDTDHSSNEALRIAVSSPMQEMSAALRYIRSSATQMDALLKGLLKLSRSGRSVLTIASLNMNELVSEVVAAIDFQVKKAGVELEVGILPPCRGDAVQVSQVFANLLNNALKYLDPARPGVIHVSGIIEEGRSIYYVADNGIGIAQAHQENIFEVFHRLEPSKSEGEGLGLTIVRQILGRLGGEVRVESRPGEGSCFSVALPATPG